MIDHIEVQSELAIDLEVFYETRTKRSVEVYRGRNSDPPPPRP